MCIRDRSGGLARISEVMSAAESEQAPVACIVIGMAGSGKTTLMQALDLYSHQADQKSYLINLDPAVLEVNFNANIDIRDTVNYKQVMKQYSLGPNGGILTSLNLFATRFDQVLKFVEARASKGETRHIFVDTPGQIEIFTWSASGSIVTELLASSFATVLIYVVDTLRCQSAVTFMSNMLYACSIMYKMKLPMVLVFNKSDVVSPQKCMSWMTDCEAFQDALQEETSYLSDLAHSQSLVLDEFYQTLKGVGVSAVTGDGMDSLFEAVGLSAQEYFKSYRPELDRLKAEKEAERERRKEEAREALAEDLSLIHISEPTRLLSISYAVFCLKKKKKKKNIIS
eukprot:TRINITY_DN3174_c0_g1_i1.p1 TRINITY_DN3174_c0_g1~~TRINITY_DN3174_c0_g1_i1.p1  ORF type:complete len:341 (-),score=117.82 TRINITY_DN3174_c0_g1_i1:87-1109(-)